MGNEGVIIIIIIIEKKKDINFFDYCKKHSYKGMGYIKWEYNIISKLLKPVLTLDKIFLYTHFISTVLPNIYN